MLNFDEELANEAAKSKFQDRWVRELKKVVAWNILKIIWRDLFWDGNWLTKDFQSEFLGFLLFPLQKWSNTADQYL